MALPTGTISMSQVNVELGRSATATISLNDAAVRGLAGVPSGAIGMNNLQGKSNVFAFTISSNQTNANLRTLAVNAGWNQSTAVQATIAGGVVISGSVAGNSTAALTIDGSWPGGVTLTNNGTIAGCGGNGGRGGDSAVNNGTAGATGGRALLVSVPVSINNAGTIAGGGGGGGGGGGVRAEAATSNTEGTAIASGGGGGGGRSSLINSSGGSPGNVAGFGSVGDAGGAGTFNGAGGGGAGGYDNPSNVTAFAGAGGSGGDWGGSGGTGVTSYYVVKNGSLRFYFTAAGKSGGAAGQAISGNGNISWIATGTRLGPIA